MPSDAFKDFAESEAVSAREGGTEPNDGDANISTLVERWMNWLADECRVVGLAKLSARRKDRTRGDGVLRDRD